VGLNRAVFGRQGGGEQSHGKLLPVSQAVWHRSLSALPGRHQFDIHEATFTRPKHLQNTGYNVNPETLEFEHRIYMQGIDPVELARILKKGIENDVFYVLPSQTRRRC